MTKRMDEKSKREFNRPDLKKGKIRKGKICVSYTVESNLKWTM